MLEPIVALDKEHALRELAATRCTFGGTIEVYDSVPSTMPLAHALARQSAIASGAAVAAEMQEAGKGRRNRSWVTPPGRALLVSFMLRRAEHPIALEYLPMLAALAVAQACEEMSIPAERLAIKWPNDILIVNGAGDLVGKVAGVLIEAVSNSSGWQHAVIGIGINVNQRRNELPAVEAPALPPTSMRLFYDAMGTEMFGVDVEMQGELDRTKLLIFLCQQLDALAKLDAAALLARYRQRLWKPDAPLVAISADHTVEGTVEGTVEDVDEQGRLLLRDSNGILHTLSSEEVSLRRATTS